MTAQLGMLAREIVIDSTNKTFIFDEGGGDVTATLAEGTYYLHGTGLSGSLLSAFITAYNAVSTTYTLSSALFVAAPGGTGGFTGGLWGYVYMEATPAPTTGTNITFRWSSGSTTFDPKLIGSDQNGSDYAWVENGSNTYFYSTHTPTPVFVPNEEAPLQDNDETQPWADIVSHVSPTNVRSHYVARSIESRKTISWALVEHDRVHYKDSGLNFTGEEWGCFRSVWNDRTYKGGRLKLFAWDYTPTVKIITSTEYVDTYVFADGPPQLMPTRRVEISQRLYDVGPLVLAPYVTP